MEQMLFFLTISSGLSFLIYGGLCIFSDHMKAEFERYGLSRYRRLVGVLEFLGGWGLLVGLFSPVVRIFSALGLALLMALGIGVRVRMKDRWIEIVPAVGLGFINAAIVWMAW